MLMTHRGVMEILFVDHYLNLGNNITPQKGVEFLWIYTSSHQKYNIKYQI